MADGRGDSSHPTPLEEQYFREAEEEGRDLDQQLAREKELAAQRLWIAFQDSATAVAHLFRDCQQQAGLAAWVPFHESASAVTELYRGSSEVCRQCTECGSRYGQQRRTRDVIAWAKKKRRLIRREELLAFLLDKPDPAEPTSDRMEGVGSAHSPHPRSSPIVSGLNFSPVPPAHYTSPLPSPRKRTVYRDDSSGALLGEGDVFSVRENGRKRTSNCGGGGGGGGNSFEFGSEVPFAKRMRL